MPRAPFPNDERERLGSLMQCQILDTDPEDVFDDLTRLASSLCKAPIALVSLVDAERQWFKSAFGLDARETHRDQAFCAHAILQPDPFVVTDAALDPRTSDNPLVTGPPHIRFYAGVPLRAPDGYALGTLCVIDTVPRNISPDQLSDLKSLARQAAALLESNKRQSELALAKSRAEAANNSKGQFLINMSHEIRTPMTAILGYTDALLDDVDLDVLERVSALETIKRNGEHLLTIINDILDTSKIESGQMSVERIETNPIQIVEEVVGLLEQRATKKGIDLVKHYDSLLPETIMSDPTRLRQILMNLIGNAIKFTEVGAVTVRLAFVEEAASSGRIELTVADTGIGMTDEQVARVRQFGAFIQADGSTTRRFGGSGLGLRISNALAKMLGGTIVVRSTAGKGSEFTLVINQVDVTKTRLLPAERLVSSCHPAADKTEQVDKPRVQQLAGVRVLLAEDGPDNQRLISFLLKGAGAQVEVVENGRLAVEYMTADATAEGELAKIPRCDVILMDMQMPEIDGYRAASMLRARGNRVPIVALTAHVTSGEREKCLAAGCHDYATKPINHAELIAKVLAWSTRDVPAGTAD